MPIKKTDKKTSPKDVFLNLLVVVTLYASATSYLALLWQYINILFPDALEGRWELFSYYASARWAIAVLIVAFPTLLFTSWFLEKQYLKNPAGRSIKTRKWLIYFTLFATALIMLSDLVTLIYNLLQGDLTTRFALKVLAIFFVAGTVFIYYLWDLRTHKID